MLAGSAELDWRDQRRTWEGLKAEMARLETEGAVAVRKGAIP